MEVDAVAYLISALSDNNIAVSKAMSMLSRDKQPLTPEQDYYHGIY